jgi:branched-chain amino acid transport system permease protein
MVSLAQVALVAVGGWVTLRLGFALDLPFELLVLISGMVTALFGVVVGLPALRMRGVYLALVTLMGAGAVQVVATGQNFPNGGSGFWGRAEPGEATLSLPRPSLAGSDAAYFRYVLVAMALAFVLVTVHSRTRPGRAWALIRTSDAAALSAGVNVTLYKTWAFGLAGFLAGVSGALLAADLGKLQAQTFFAPESILLFALVVAAGPRLLTGAVLAGVLYRVVPARLTEWGLDPDLALVLFGLALFHALITAPDGIAGQVGSIRHRVTLRWSRG